MSDSRSPARWHAPSVLVGVVIALAGVGVGAWITSATPQALASRSVEAGGDIPAIELDEKTVALVVDRSGRFFLVDQKGRAGPVRLDDDLVRNVPGTEILTAR